MADPQEAYLDDLGIIMINTIDETHVFNDKPPIAISVMLYKVWP